jgi:exonuclease V
MKRGTVVHETLEKEVHDFVPIQVKTKEDKFGLKIWNIIQGLRCLRLTGMTREVEVWGIIDGELVNGIIDELSYSLPEADLEKISEVAREEKKTGNGTTVSLSVQPSNALFGDTGMLDHWLGSLEPGKTVYITDVKTRGVKSIPSGATLRPTYMQLMLYRKLLAALASNSVDADFVFARYNLDPLEPFSPVFISEVNRTGFDLPQSDSDGESPSVGDTHSTSMGELDVHNNLSALWSLMISEFSRAIPFASISNVLRAEFRWTRTGDIIGSHMFLYDDSVLTEYISSGMSWWKGKRTAQGVEVEEAFKCRSCDFADTCTWRIGKVEEATLKHRMRAAGRAKSSV